jgi:hypothetical protein
LAFLGRIAPQDDAVAYLMFTIGCLQHVLLHATSYIYQVSY